MQSKIRLIATITIIMAVAFVSCKKTDTTPATKDTSAEIATQADDQSIVSTEVDAIANDAKLCSSNKCNT